MKEIKIPFPEKEDIDEALVRLMKFFLDSEAKSKIYLYLRKIGPSTSTEIARGANLYPSSTREALASMAKKGFVTRKKLEKEGTGKKPYIYEAIPPAELLKIKLSGIEERVNNLLNLDRYFEGERVINYSSGPYKVRIEKLVDDKGEELVLIESQGGPSEKNKVKR